ncbi:MAG TPA: element excision factor XisH family protein [Saprospiraceae bacterium]|nr:element excision factor XisH family protein [Saprospiraceae bacterium]
MSKKDHYHDLVRRALENDGWKITHDPLVIPAGKRKIKVDLGAEPLIAAEKGNEKIAVEVKSFLNLSLLYDFYEALGQFKFYWYALQKFEPDRKLFLAVSTDVYSEFFDDPFIREVSESENLHTLVFDIEKETIAQWIR